ncbi:MAG: radical SAM protein [Candidatus Aenigmatarchaeota archaeon]
MATIIPITSVCNQCCIYCSSYDISIPSDDLIKKQILSEKEEVVFTGGEPTLRKDINDIIKIARNNKVKEIELQTNGVMLCYKSLVRELIDSGVTMFNVAMPSHIEEISDKITQTHGLFEKRLQGIRNLLELNANVRITMVINKLNSDTLYEYTKFIHLNFPEIKILELNFIKILGRAKLNKWLVPKLSNIKNELRKSMAYCKENKINLLIDGIPLCHMQNYEEYSIDAIKFIMNRQIFFETKEKNEKCLSCSLTKICRGFREGYKDIYGSNEFIPSSQSLDDIQRKILSIDR